jgi:hypothetical protein
MERIETNPVPRKGLPTPIFVLVLAAYVVGLTGWGGSIFAGWAGLAAALLFPGNALLVAASAPRSRSRDLVAGIALSPVVLGAVLIAVALTGGTPAPWLRGTILGCGTVLILLRVVNDGAPPDPDEDSGWIPWAIGLAGAVVVGLVLIPAPWRRIGADSWFHTAVVLEMARGGLPPQDPYFAGLTLQYFWFYHAVLLALREVSGINPPDAMTLLNILAVVLCIPAAARVGRALGFSRAAGAWGGVLFLLGMGGLFWLFYPVKLVTVFIGDVRGTEALRQIFSLREWSPSTTAHLTQFLNSSSFMLRKFMIGTAVPWALLLLLVTVDAAVRFVRGGGASRGFVISTAAAGAFLFHVVIGGASVAAVVVGAGILFLFPTPARGRALGAAILAAAALVVCLPYLRALVPPQSMERNFPFGVSLRVWASAPFTFTGVVLLSLPVWRRFWRERTPEGVLFMGWAVASVGYGLFGRLPPPNLVDKPPIVMYIPLALAAGFAVPGIWRALSGRRKLRIAFAVLLALYLVPENALQWTGYYVQASPPALTPAEQHLYAWIGRETPADAVFLDSNDRAEVVVRGPRRQYWGIPSYAEQWGYDREAVGLRRRTRDAVYGTGKLTPPEVAGLAALHAPVYVITRETDTPGAAARLAALPRRYRRVWSEDGLAVFRMRLPGSRSGR